MTSKYILTVTLNPAIDKTVFCNNFQLDSDHRCQDIHFSAGGKGINVSRVLTQLKIPNLATGCVGGTSGDYISKALSQESINHKFCQINNDTRTSLTIIDKELNKTTRLLESGPEVTPEERVRFLELFSILIQDASWVIFSGRSLRGIGDDFYQKLIEICKFHKINSVLDSSGQHFLKGLSSKPTLVKPNIEEAEELIGKKITSKKEIIDACIEIKKRGANYVCLSQGSKGAVLFNGKDLFWGEVPKIKEESPVGCGDAFIAGFIAALHQQKDLESSFRFALSCGSANALNKQPGKIDLKIVDQISKEVKILKG